MAMQILTQEFDVCLSAVHIMLGVQDFPMKGVNLYLADQPSNMCTHAYDNITHIALDS